MTPTKQQKRFQEFFRECILENFSWRIVLLVIGIGGIAILKLGLHGVDVFLNLLLSIKFWLLIMGALLADSIIRSAYWHVRVRNPRYIAKQEAYERMQAERAAKQAAVKEPGAADKPGNDKTS